MIEQNADFSEASGDYQAIVLDLEPEQWGKVRPAPGWRLLVFLEPPDDGSDTLVALFTWGSFFSHGANYEPLHFDLESLELRIEPATGVFWVDPGAPALPLPDLAVLSSMVEAFVQRLAALQAAAT